MPRFRKKPLVVEATQFWPEQLPWPEGVELNCNDSCLVHLPHVHTLEGPLHVSPGDWIVKGAVGEIYPVKPAVFAATCEPVAELSTGTQQPEPWTDPGGDPYSLESFQKRWAIEHQEWCAIRDELIATEAARGRENREGYIVPVTANDVTVEQRRRQRERGEISVLGTMFARRMIGRGLVER